MARHLACCGLLWRGMHAMYATSLPCDAPSTVQPLGDRLA